MTKAAKQFGKRLDNFLANEGTSEYITELGNLIPGIPVTKAQRVNGASLQVGTWTHPA